MDIGFGLLQQQQLKLVMTPELRQSITMLQYSAMELSNFLQEQAKENPLLEVQEPEYMQPDAQVQAETRESYEEREDTWSYAEFESYNKEEYVNPVEYYAVDNITLQDYLLEQVQFLPIEEKEKRLLSFLIGNVDDNGYLRATYDLLPDKVTYSVDDWDNAVSALQQLEPYGVGARNLVECLLIQCRQMMLEDGLLEIVIRDHLQELATKRFQIIAAKLNTTVERIQQIEDQIKELQPKPGVLFHSKEPTYIVPDVYIDRAPNGSFVVYMNDRILPRIQLNTDYYSLLHQQDASRFLQERLQQYQWLVKSLAQRKRTILNVTQAILDSQLPFFESGEAFLKPLTLKEIADKIEVHESTVSRATNQKYVQTPRGLFELKYFFSQRISCQGGSDASAEQVKFVIKKLIDNENKQKPLSDQKIVKALEDQGIQVARRTVAKYREDLGLLSSTQRKRYNC